MPQAHRQKSETYKLILDLLAEEGVPLTRTEIARGIHRQKTPHLISLIDGMVDKGLLEKNVKTFHNGVQGYVYTVKKSTDAPSPPTSDQPTT